MDAASALADLTEIASQVEEAAILEPDGTVVAATAGGERVASAASELLRVAEARLGRPVRELEAVLREGGVFVVRGEAHSVAARTLPRPHSALVRHDLAACLASMDAVEPARA